MASDNDAATITGVLSTAPLCETCLARQAGLSRSRLDEVFLRVVVTVSLVSRLNHCSSCRALTTAHCLS
jgi:hypothetical protein